jgi:protein TonB
MHRMVPAFILAVLIHTLLLTADASRLIRQEPVVPQARLLTMRLVDRTPYSPPLTHPLPVPPPPIPAAPPKPALKGPAIKPVPVVKPSRPITKKPPEKSDPALPPPVADPVRTATDLPPSLPYAVSAATPADPDATPGESSSAVSAEVRATAKYSDNPPPVYPSIARRRGYEGTVVLEVFVGEDGRVGEVRIAESSSYRLLDRSAIKAVEGWQFEPGSQGGKTVAMWVRVPVDFRLQ